LHGLSYSRFLLGEGSFRFLECGGLNALGTKQKLGESVMTSYQENGSSVQTIFGTDHHVYGDFDRMRRLLAHVRGDIVEQPDEFWRSPD
jgi:hypothetical protein